MPWRHAPTSPKLRCRSDRKGSPYDRGHQAPAGDQTKDPKLKAETFYLSNMAPQIPMFNQRIWGQLEDLARTWATEYGEVWIVTGGMIYDPAEENPATADGWIKYSVIGPDGVAVPTHFYKIVARPISESNPGAMPR
jgi:endonuclease G